MKPELTPEQREELRKQEDLAAIREGLADFEAGRVTPLDESIESIRKNLKRLTNN